MTNKSKLPGKIIISSIFLDIQAKKKDEPKAQILVITGVWAFLFCPTRYVLFNISDLLTSLRGLLRAVVEKISHFIIIWANALPPRGQFNP